MLPESEAKIWLFQSGQRGSSQRHGAQSPAYSEVAPSFNPGGEAAAIATSDEVFTPSHKWWFQSGRRGRSHRHSFLLSK
jgi:hypothetical protein